MAKCSLSGKRPLKGHSVSHANNRTRKWQYPNVQKKRIWVSELNKYVTLNISARALKTLNKIGLVQFAKKEGLNIKKIL